MSRGAQTPPCLFCRKHFEACAIPTQERSHLNKDLMCGDNSKIESLKKPPEERLSAHRINFDILEMKTKSEV